MIPWDVLAIPSPSGTDVDLLDALLECLQARGNTRDDVVSLTFFVGARDAATFAAHRARWLARTRKVFDGWPLPTSVVAQAPEGGLALEAKVVHGSAACVTRRLHARAPYTVVTAPGVRQVHGASVAPRVEGDAARSAREAFADVEAVLRREGLGFAHVVRQWAYVEGLLDVHADAGGEGRRGYQIFNDARRLAYGSEPFPRGYPAATAIGQAHGGMQLEFLALETARDVRVEALSNPRQADAHHYSPRILVGPASPGLRETSPPLFERAKRIASRCGETILVSGTASILGERSTAAGDVVTQTRTTLENIAALVDGRPLTHLRAYVKRATDIPWVRALCTQVHGEIPALYLQADVCRPELLVEIEGALVVDAAPRTDP